MRFSDEREEDGDFLAAGGFGAGLDLAAEAPDDFVDGEESEAFGTRGAVRGEEGLFSAIMEGDLEQFREAIGFGKRAAPDDGEDGGAAGDLDFATKGLGFAGDLPDGGGEPAGLNVDVTGERFDGLCPPAGSERRGFDDERGQIIGTGGNGFGGKEQLQREALAEDGTGVVGGKADGTQGLLKIL